MKKISKAKVTYEIKRGGSPKAACEVRTPGTKPYICFLGCALDV